ncbi:hypothetical protein DFH27DRAFT_474634, partial [Peziza echinospora]
WVEAKPLATSIMKAVVGVHLGGRHLYTWGVLGRLAVDGYPEKKDLVRELAKRYGVKRIQVSAYRSQGNDMVKRGHKPI